jgi:hypothetical protein
MDRLPPAMEQRGQEGTLLSGILASPSRGAPQSTSLSGTTRRKRPLTYLRAKHAMDSENVHALVVLEINEEEDVGVATALRCGRRLIALQQGDWEAIC